MISCAMKHVGTLRYSINIEGRKLCILLASIAVLRDVTLQISMAVPLVWRRVCCLSLQGDQPL
jgi:hypothetical protein